MKDGKLNYHYERDFSPAAPHGNIDLVQIGTSYCRPGAKIKLHSHVGFFELTYVTAGKGRIFANNSSVIANAGNIFVSFPFDTHSIEADENEGMNYNFCAFYLRNEALLAEMDSISIRHARTSDRIIESDILGSALSSAIAEVGREGVLRDIYIEALFTQILVNIVRAFDKQKVASSIPTRDEELCYQIMDYINTHIYSITYLSSLSNAFGYDYAYLSKIFSRTTSQSISDYYRFQRLEVARTLIHEDRMKLSEIAEKLRYSSIYSFSKAFKKQYSVSPREYKKKNHL